MCAVRILVVDDDPSMGELLRDQLAFWGCDAVRAGGVDEALARMTEGIFQAVVSDLHMPPANGFMLLAAVCDRWPGIPVVLMSAFPAPDTEKQALEAGAAGFLAKPFPMDEFREVLDRALAPIEVGRKADGVQ